MHPSSALLQAYALRRRQLAQTIQNGVVVIPNAPEVIRSYDSHYPYRSNSYFDYLCGFPEPEATLVLQIENGELAHSILFCREKNLEQEIWEGYRYGPVATPEIFQVNNAFSIATLNEKLPEILTNQPSLYTLLGLYPEWDRQIIDIVNTVRKQARSGAKAPHQWIDIREHLNAMRLCKDSEEIALLRKAGQISAEAHQKAMRATQPGSWEYQIEGVLLQTFLHHGAMSPAYPSIVAGGANACVLHYRANNCLLRDGDLLLVDAGCEYQNYASDITRTWPVNGQFSGPQRAIYELVLAAQTACIEEVKPGKPFNAYHEKAISVLTQGLLDLGLLQGSYDEAIETQSYKSFYMHRAGHWLGLDTHDPCPYRTADGEWMTLTPGMVLTVEPGLYIRPDPKVPESFWNIGVRIEDDLLVTAQGNENLTAAVPKKIEEIETLMRG